MIGAGIRPEWIHRSLRLELSAGCWYEFRTLSLYDVIALWPHITTLTPALTEGRLMAFGEHLVGALEVINPTLAANREHWPLLKGAHLDALLELYRGQDWPRIAKLGEYNGTTRQDDDGPGDPSLTLMMICAAASRMVNMSVIDFMQERFEFCADAILSLRRQQELAERAGKVPADEFGRIMEAILPTQKIDPANRPAFIDRIEELARKHGAN